MYDMYGKFMAGLDIENIYGNMVSDAINPEIINGLIRKESALIDDDININIIPRMQIDMRNLNSVTSSSYVIQKSLIEDNRTKKISRLSSNLKFLLLPTIQDRWSSHLDWNTGITETYMEVLKSYYKLKIDTDEANYIITENHALWPFTVLEFEQAALATMRKSRKSRTKKAKGSMALAVASGMASGAMTGAMYGSMFPGIGTLIGAIIGAVVFGVASYLTYEYSDPGYEE